MNPLNWTGPEFLMLYVPLMVVGYVWARTVARPPKPPDTDALSVGQRLDAYEVALLRGVGPFRDAVAASLVHRGVFQLEGDQLLVSKPPRTDMTPLERSVVRASGGQPLSRKLLATALETEVARLREKLILKGLMHSVEEARSRRKLPLLVFSALAALGLIKMVVGLLRGRPMGFLFFLIIFGLVFFFPLLRVRRGRTPLGDRVLSALAAEHEALRTSASSEGSLPTLSGAEVALAVALFGTTALASTQMTPMRQYLQTPPPAAATSGGSGDYSSCGCGGADSSWSSSSASSWSSSSDSSSSDSSSSDSGGSSDSRRRRQRRRRRLRRLRRRRRRWRLRPLAGVGLGWRRQLAHRIDQDAGLGFVEVLAEHLNPAAPLPRPLVRLKERGVPVVLHAVSLSLGGAEPPDARRLDTLARLAERLGAVCVSEHVAFVRAGGIESGHLLPVPRADEALDILAENVRLAQAALPVPLALENIATLFEWPSPAFTEARLLAGLLARTSALLLLDVANLHANALNHGTDTEAVLAAVPRERLAYVHVAGGVRRGALYHDTHAHPVPEGPLALLEALTTRLGPVPALLERDDHFPTAEELNAELRAIEAAVQRGVAKWEATQARTHPQATRALAQVEARP